MIKSVENLQIQLNKPKEKIFFHLHPFPQIPGPKILDSNGLLFFSRNCTKALSKTVTFE